MTALRPTIGQQLRAWRERCSPPLIEQARRRLRYPRHMLLRQTPCWEATSAHFKS
jgi:hypothetical protein